jgi:hypothetical protein
VYLLITKKLSSTQSTEPLSTFMHLSQLLFPPHFFTERMPRLWRQVIKKRFAVRILQLIALLFVHFRRQLCSYREIMLAVQQQKGPFKQVK